MPGQGGEGRWALLPDVRTLAAEHPSPLLEDPDELAEQVAGQLLARWGVVFYDLVSTETLALPWRELLWALRRLEARGLVRGGRFVAGFSGEQFALPEAVEELRRLRRRKPAGEVVRLSAADPLNLTGVVLPGARVPARRKLAISYRDGTIVSEPSTEVSPSPRALPAMAGVGTEGG